MFRLANTHCVVWIVVVCGSIISCGATASGQQNPQPQSPPAQTAPTRPAPPQTAPSQTAPAQTAPSPTTQPQTAPATTAPAQTATVKSPNGQVLLEVSANGVLRYHVTFRNHPVVNDSPLTVDLAAGVTLGPDSHFEGVETREVNETYTQPVGKRSHITNHCNEAIVSLRGRNDARFQLLLRAYDDGVAFRYRFLPAEGQTELSVVRENDVFSFPDKSAGYALPLNSFTTSYEKRYERKALTDIPADWILGMPLLVEIPGTGWAAVTEANLTDYAGMYLSRADGATPSLVSRLSRLPNDPGFAVRAKLPHDSPWRVIILGDSPARLLESDILLNLNEPSAIKDVSWIHPGKTTFPWWNGYYEEKLPFKCDLNTATAKYYIDFCAQYHIPYHSLDGKGNVAWYGGPIVPYEGATIVQGVPGLDLQEVLRYAKEKGVRLRLWMHWGAARRHMKEAFPLYQKWGVEGVMIDFMDRDDQQMINFMRDVLETAAANRLTVTFHGVCKPTGLERTFPNLLTSEGAMNYEYDKWDPIGIPPEHDLTLVFTRMLAGPMDFHQGSLRGVPVNQYKPRNEAPLVMGTPARMIATYVVFENHLPMVADYPSAYRDNPGTHVISRIPTTWDDTKVFAADIGKLAVIARRSGKDWWIGAMGGRDAVNTEVPLKFLGDGHFNAEMVRNDPNDPHHIGQETTVVSDADTLLLRLGPADGATVHLAPVEGK